MTARRLGRTRVKMGVLAGALAAVLIAAALMTLLLPPPAGAEQPFRVGSQIEDRAAVLGGREDDVWAAIEELQDGEQVQLWVTFVDTFSGVAAQDWANETAVQSDLGLRDVLLAVAVQDRAYAYSVEQDFPLSQEQLDGVMTASVEPRLSDDDWAGAAIGAADGIGEALRGEAASASSGGGSSSDGGGSSFPWLLAIGAVVLVAVIAWFFVRARSRRAAEGVPATGGADVLPLDELRRRANAELVAADDAVKTSTQELDFAVAEFGEEQAAPFRQALEEARGDVAEAFRLRNELDDDDDEGRQRELLTAILQHTDAANTVLDAQADRFDSLRDLERNAPEVLAKLEGQLTELEARRPQVADELAALAAGYAPAALLAVRRNPDEAQARIDFAREQIRLGREDLAAERRGEAAVSALAARGGRPGRRRQLLDAVGRLRQELQEAGARIDEAVAETRRDIAEAQAAGAGSGWAAHRRRRGGARRGRRGGRRGGRARPAGGASPPRGGGCVPRAGARQRPRRAGAAWRGPPRSLERTLLAARSEVASAEDFITTHRGAVGSGPRTLLAGAQRSLDQAMALAASDPVTAAHHAAQAQQQAARALSDASDEAQQGAGMGMPGMPGMPGAGRSGGDIGGMILGGILAGMLGGGGFGGGSGGGRSRRLRRRRLRAALLRRRRHAHAPRRRRTVLADTQAQGGSPWPSSPSSGASRSSRAPTSTRSSTRRRTPRRCSTR